MVDVAVTAPLIRLGVPLVCGALPRAAGELGAAVLFSANAFRRGGRWRPISPALATLDCALDSAGFVAMVRYGGYPWSRDEYLDLCRAHPWTWYATRDFCCEPQIARNRGEVLKRVTATVDEFFALRRLATLERGMRAPMPVLQGWEPDDYALCADLYGFAAWPSLVGLGSVCRRQLHGRDGVARIVDDLDRRLPFGVRLHLFGVKGDVLEALRGHPRVGSIDSMAWDFAARRAGGDRSMSNRIEHMRRWYARVTERAARPGWTQQIELRV